jgi:hypothetical protein
MFVRIRPRERLSYEHMFPWSTPSPLTRRARTALSLARSFLLLEDDYDVDWEVDQDEPGRESARGREDAHDGSRALGRRAGTRRRDELRSRGILGEPDAAGTHPHRAWLRGRSARERAGQPTQAPQVCVSPCNRAGTVTPSPRRTGRPRAARM